MARFDDERRRWLSDCKRCSLPLVRERQGVWRPAPAQSDILCINPLRAIGTKVGGHPEARTAPPETIHDGEERSVNHFRSKTRNGVRESGSVLEQGRAQAIVYQLLDDVLVGNVAPPGALGALFSVIDELRANHGMEEQTRRAERISIRIHQLELALQHGDEKEASLARRQLTVLAGEWINMRICSAH
jgi:hypothetical protein